MQLNCVKLSSCIVLVFYKLYAVYTIYRASFIYEAGSTSWLYTSARRASSWALDERTRALVVRSSSAHRAHDERSTVDERS